MNDNNQQPESDRIPTWQEQCETHPDHQNGIVTDQMIQDRMQEEIDRLRNVVQWEQHRQERIGTHGNHRHAWGHQHYECLLRKYQKLRSEK